MAPRRSPKTSDASSSRVKRTPLRSEIDGPFRAFSICSQISKKDRKSYASKHKQPIEGERLMSFDKPAPPRVTSQQQGTTRLPSPEPATISPSYALFQRNMDQIFQQSGPKAGLLTPPMDDPMDATMEEIPLFNDPAQIDWENVAAQYFSNGTDAVHFPPPPPIFFPQSQPANLPRPKPVNLPADLSKAWDELVLAAVSGVRIDPRCFTKIQQVANDRAAGITNEKYNPCTGPGCHHCLLAMASNPAGDAAFLDSMNLSPNSGITSMSTPPASLPADPIFDAPSSAIDNPVNHQLSMSTTSDPAAIITPPQPAPTFPTLDNTANRQPTTDDTAIDPQFLTMPPQSGLTSTSTTDLAQNTPGAAPHSPSPPASPFTQSLTETLNSAEDDYSQFPSQFEDLVDWDLTTFTDNVS